MYKSKKNRIRVSATLMSNFTTENQKFSFFKFKIILQFTISTYLGPKQVSLRLKSLLNFKTFTRYRFNLFVLYCFYLFDKMILNEIF